MIFFFSPRVGLTQVALEYVTRYAGLGGFEISLEVKEGVDVGAGTERD